MLQKFKINYPDEILDKLYLDFSRCDMDIYTFEEFCFVRYGQYVADYSFKQRRMRTYLLVSTYM